MQYYRSNSQTRTKVIETIQFKLKEMFYMAKKKCASKLLDGSIMAKY